MKKYFQYGAVLAATIALTACGNLSQVKSNGTTDHPVWPKIQDAGINGSGSGYGIWPNWDNVRQLEPGMNKEQLYYLIGRPHYSEGLFAVREWDFVFNYRQQGEHKYCQLKVLFDKDMNAQSYLWKPQGCNIHYEIMGDSLFTVAGTQPKDMSGEMLFDFDSAKLSTTGKIALYHAAMDFKHNGIDALAIDGYTDPLGSEKYNLALSKRRAEAVKAYFVELGFDGQKIVTTGYGEQNQKVVCDNGKGLKQCLKPNRRVVISPILP